MFFNRNLWDIERTFNEMNRMFDLFDRPMGLRSVPRGTFPAVNLYDEGDHFTLEAVIPGVDQKELDLTVEQNTVTLAGKRETMTENGHRFYRHERGGGQFKRTMSLGERIDPGGASAQLKNGILVVTLPKEKKSEQKKIAIQAN